MGRRQIAFGDGDPAHGTRNGYVNYKCRCYRCRKAHREYDRQYRRNLAPLAPDDPKHGTKYGYDCFRCRCEPCTAAAAAYEREARRLEKETAGSTLPADDPRHGTRNAYSNFGCRCPACKAVASDYERERRRKADERKAQGGGEKSPARRAGNGP